MVSGARHGNVAHVWCATLPSAALIAYLVPVHGQRLPCLLNSPSDAVIASSHATQAAVNSLIQPLFTFTLLSYPLYNEIGLHSFIGFRLKLDFCAVRIASHALPQLPHRLPLLAILDMRVNLRRGDRRVTE